jgi:hypothetical protein
VAEVAGAGAAVVVAEVADAPRWEASAEEGADRRWAVAAVREVLDRKRLTRAAATDLRWDRRRARVLPHDRRVGALLPRAEEIGPTYRAREERRWPTVHRSDHPAT